MNLLVGPFMRLDKPDKKVTGNSFFNWFINIIEDDLLVLH